jgi:hypothetical protein
VSAQAIEISEHRNVSAPVSETAAIIHMIERLARDPSVDLERMRELMTMRRDVLADEAKEAFNNALAVAQSEMRSVTADASNPQTRSKYATYHAVDKALRPVYTRHGLALTFDTGKADEENYVRVLCTVALGKHERTYHIDMPADGKGAKGNDVMTKTHAVGSAVTYGRRYLLLMIFNVAIGEHDDDGNAAGGGDRLTEQQIDVLRSLIVETASDIPKFCKFMKVERIEDIAARDFDKARLALEAKKAKS